MFSHTTIGAASIASAKEFYNAALAPLGVDLKMDVKGALGYGPVDQRQPQFFVVKPFNGEQMSPGNGAMVAFNAGSRAMVDGFHAAVLKAGGTCEGPPGLRPHYHKNYYGAYVRDPDGNKLCAVCHLPE
ncbi:VOC family protein [Terrarubrum flagellatum]|uniref:VOC family protein n=1 Tax=Terrirubrum flagellatum TaxID=2895980 RepID=UPI003145563F